MTRDIVANVELAEGAGDDVRGSRVPVSAVTIRPSVDQRAASQPQEHVLERRPPDEDRLGIELALARGYHDALAVVGLEQDAIGELLDAVGEAIEPPVECLLDLG